MSIMGKYLTSPQIGKAGELRVRSELILQGFVPAVCDQDDGVDIILVDNGKKLQVKTCSRPSNDVKNYSYKYSFSIRSANLRNTGDGVFRRKVTRKSYAGVADYFIFWCIEHDLFYILPENVVGERVSILIPTPTEDRTYRINDRKSKSKYEQYKNAWHLLA
jgi:hypothetical protein